jgi:VanZ family protein
MLERRPVWSWLFFAQLALVVLATSLATLGWLPTAVFRPPFDKVGHFAAYGLLSFLAVSFFGRARAWPVVIALLVAATLEEISQRAFPTRTFDLGDLAMNVAGITTLGALAAARGAARGRAAFAVRAPEPLRELAAAEAREAASVDVALVRQCREEARLRAEVVSAQHDLAHVRASGRASEPPLGVLGWFLMMFAGGFTVVFFGIALLAGFR